MPLLRLKPFKPEIAPKHLKADDEVFLCDLTGEVFTDYEAFYQRMILCNSLVWSCEISGKPNLTFKEAQECEKGIRKSLSAIPFSLKLGILYCVHHTRRSKIQVLADQIYDYFRTRYQIDEKVEVKIKDKWTEGIVSELPYSVDISLQNKLNCHKEISPLNSPTKEKLKAFNTILTSLKSKSPLENKELRPETSELNYKVLILTGPKKGETAVLKGKSIRRVKKGAFSKDKVKLFVKQTCRRTTTSSDDGYWNVEKKEVGKFGLGVSCVKVATLNTLKKASKPLKPLKPVKTPEIIRKEAEEQERQRVLIEQRKAELTLEREKKKNEIELIKEQKLRELEEQKALKEQKLKDKEVEKARKKDERERERELNLEKKNLELDFVREFNKPREDLQLEDSKPLASLVQLETPLDQDLIGDAVMVVEFVSTFGSLFDLEQEIDVKVTLKWLEEALCEHDAEGNYFTILKFLLHSYLRLDKEENDYKEEEDEEDEDSDDDNSAAKQLPSVPDTGKKASAHASAAAAWAMLHQGMALSDITIEPFSLTEVLRLHILSSGVRIGGTVDWNQWQRKGQYQLSDDPCVSFRHHEKDIMKTLMTSSVYDLSPGDKLKLLNLICNQCLMLSTVREYMEDAYDKVKTLRKDLRDAQGEENQRRRKIQQDKWKKKVNERKKLKEEIKLEKERKLLEVQQKQQQAMERLMQKLDEQSNNKVKPSSPGTPGTPATPGTPVENNGSPKVGTPVNEKETPETLREAKELKEQQERDKLEKLRKKEEKEQQVEDFYREKFSFKETEINQEIAENMSIISKIPVGSDRYFRRYWKFDSYDGLLIENDSEAMFEATDSDSGEESDVDDTSTYLEEIATVPKPAKNKPKPSIPKVTFDDIIQAKKEGVSLTRLVLNRYRCNYTNHTEDIVSKSTKLKPLIENIFSGHDPRTHMKDNKVTKWYDVSTKEQYESILETLNIRGIREQVLSTGLSSAKTQIFNSWEERERQANKKTRTSNVKSENVNDIDKNLFETMDDYIEGNLRDHLLEIEERLWVGSIGIIKCDNRIAWRTTIEQGMIKLIKYDSPTKKGNSDTTSTPATANTDLVDVKEKIVEDDEMSIDEGVCVENGIDSFEMQEDTESTKEEIGDGVGSAMKDPSIADSGSMASVKVNGVKDVTSSPSALPLHIKGESTEDTSRCSTPTAVESEQQLVVKELAEALLMIERGIENKFLKPPLGETEETKRENIKEKVAASAADGGEGSKEEDEKKSSTCLSRWEESLVRSMSFAQVFIHLDTLDRSILWDKSIQNTKCRLCRRKGNEDEMLLCDGCDRGFHMSCLKPKMKTVPEGDWFCHDCRPIEIKSRRSRKQSVRDDDDTEEESEQETEEEDIYSQSDSQSDGDEEEEEEEEEGDEEEYEEEEEEEGEDESGDEVSEHGEHCTVCNEEGTLILCDECPRAYHLGCCYPAMKKVPRGNWLCQICSGLDKELYWKKRAKTQERNRALVLDPPKSKAKTKKQQRGQAGSKVKAVKEKKRNSSPLLNNKPAKRARTDDESSPLATQRLGFNRFQLKNCSTLIGEIFNQPEAEDFLIPVDNDEVPDYKDFIDTPIDFGTIKRKLNMAKYMHLQDFLDDIYLIFSNCETYNPPKSRVNREGAKLKAFVKKRVKELGLG